MALPATGYDLATATNPGTALTDFTLMVDLKDMSTDWWSAVGSETDGTKGRAAIDSSEVELACDWIDFDSTADTGLLRVKWTGTLAASGTQKIRIYPPVAANASVAVGATYGQHNAYDDDWNQYHPYSVDNKNRKLSTQTPSTDGLGVSIGTTAGKFGQATTFTSAGSVSWTLAGITGVPMTLSCWSKSSGTYDQAIRVSDAVEDFYQLYVRLATGQQPVAIHSGTYQAKSTFSTALGTSTWRYQVARFDTNSSRTAFENAVAATENTQVNSGGVGTAIVSIPHTSLTGQAHDLQLHSTNRSNPWISQEYAQTSDNATFWGTWAWESWESPFEDPTTYTLGGTNSSEITTNTDTVTLTALDCTGEAYLYKDFGIDYFQDFNVQAIINVTANGAGLPSFEALALSNTPDEEGGGLEDAFDGLSLRMQTAGTQVPVGVNYEDATNTGLMTGTAYSTDLYVTFERTGTVLTVSVYTGSHGGTLVDTETLAVPITDYRYLYIGQSRGAGSGDVTATLRNIEVSTSPRAILNYILEPTYRWGVSES